MRNEIANGIVAGLIGGIIFGIMMQMMTAPTPEGGQMPMMAMVAKVVRSDSVAIGWLYHLFNSAVIGGIFGWLLGTRSHTFGAGLGWGAVYGFAWWIMGGLILMPLLLGMPPFAPRFRWRRCDQSPWGSSRPSYLRRRSRWRLSDIDTRHTRSNSARIKRSEGIARSTII